MAYLCISKYRSPENVVKLKEGEVYEIDRYTSRYLNSDAIRARHSKEMKQFRELYLDGKNGGIRIFIPDKDHPEGYKEWQVIYKKHVIAFNEIIKNVKFMHKYANEELSKSKPFLSRYDLNGILRYNFNASVRRVVRGLKTDDKINGGGKSYYAFMRNILIRYNQYIEKYPEMPSIDDIYNGHIGKLDNASLERTNNFVRIKAEDLMPAYEEWDPVADYNKRHDEYLTRDEINAMDKEDPYEFFTHPEFDRVHGEKFIDSHVVLAGNQDRAFYQEWYEVCEHSFPNGTICCPNIGKSVELMLDLNDAKMLVMCIAEEDRSLSYQIASAIQNEMKVVVISDNISLIEKYKGKFKGAKYIHLNENDRDIAKSELIDYFVDLHKEESNERKYGN